MLEDEIPYSNSWPHLGSIPGCRPALRQSAVVIADHHLDRSSEARQPGSKLTNDVLRHTGKRVHEIAEKEDSLRRPSVDETRKLIQLPA
jgi:metallophosphoesterase superfamily enzyme